VTELLAAALGKEPHNWLGTIHNHLLGLPIVEVTRNRFEALLLRFGPPPVLIQNLLSVCTGRKLPDEKYVFEHAAFYRPWQDFSNAAKVVCISDPPQTPKALDAFRKQESRMVEQSLRNQYHDRLRTDPEFLQRRRRMMVSLSHSRMPGEFLLSSAHLEQSTGKVVVAHTSFVHSVKGYTYAQPEETFEEPTKTFGTIADLLQDYATSNSTFLSFFFFFFFLCLWFVLKGSVASVYVFHRMCFA
jgi:hypothetical protein